MRTLLLLSLLTLSTLAGCATPHTRPPTPVGLDGSAASVFVGHASATVLLFTRTDCPISNRYAPEVNRLDAAYRDKGVTFVLVYVDPDEPPAAIRQHLTDYGYHMRAVRDPDHSLVHLSGATVTPQAAVFDRDQHLTYLGRISDLYVDVGNPRARATTRDLAEALDATLAGRPAPHPRTQAVGCIIADLKR